MSGAAAGPVAAAAAWLLVGCSGPSSTPAAAQRSAAPVPGERVVASLSSRGLGLLGDVLVDDAGRTVYANSGERASDSTTCDSTCRRTWPLVLAPPTGVPSAAGAARADLLGVADLGGARAVTYAGHPLHLYVGDADPGGAAGQGVQGIWACVTVAGTPAVGAP